MYFKQHSEQARYNKLITNKTTLKKIINADVNVYIFNSQYSFSNSSNSETSFTDYYHSPEFEDCAKLYQTFRIVGCKLNVYRVGQPALITTQNTNHEWGLLGLRTTMTQANIMQEDTAVSDNTFWISYLGNWMTVSKFTSFNSNRASTSLTDWSPITAQSKQVFLHLANKGNVSIPDGYQIYTISVQYMIEFGNPN